MRKLFTLSFLVLGLAWTTKAQITVFPHVENWESQANCGTGCAQACVLTNGWTNDLTDDIDWAVDRSGTGSFNTGPTANGGADHNPGVAGGAYLYTETSSGCNGDTARLLSPEIHIPNTMSNFTCEWWWHMFGSDQATSSGFYVDVRQISGGTPGPWTNVDFVAPVNMDLWQQGLINLSAYIGDTIEMRWWYRTGNSFGSDAALDDISFYELLANDAGVVSIDAPINPITPGIDTVCVTIENFGFDTLMNANIGWSVAGVPQTPFAWTGSVAPGGQEAVCIGTFNFVPGLTEICAWTSMPNMVQDSAPSNDTTCRSLCTPLAGVYTLGGGGDFSSFTELGDILSSCGVDSHVIVNVMPGMYMEDLYLDNVPGTADTATILIDGGDTSLVWLESGGITIEFEGTDWTTIRNITINNTATTDGFGVQFHDASSNNTIDSCRIMMAQVANATDLIGVSASNSPTSSFTEGQNAFWTTVSNCHIIGGEKGIHFEGQNGFGNRNIGNRFMNNWIQDCEDYGFYIDDQDSMTIWGNTIESTRWTAFADGIYCFDIQMFNISHNMATDIPDWGMYIADGNYNLDGAPTSRGLISNNMISSQTDYAMYLDDFEFTDIYYNTAYNQSTFSGAIRINDYATLDIRNNLFVSDGDYAFECDEASNGGGFLNLNYNTYWTGPASGTKFVDDGPNLYLDLPAWQVGRPTHNINSGEGDPVFVSAPDDLHVIGLAANDTADATVNITMDIDGDTRPAGPKPDNGADEYTPLNNDAVFVTMLEPGGIACGDSNTAVTVVIKNFGQVDITSLPITVNLTGDITQTLNVTYTDTLGFNECDTVSMGTVNTYAGAMTVNFDGWVALAGDQNTSNDTINPLGTATFIPVEPVGIAQSDCGTDSALICGQNWPGVNYAWYATPTDTTPIWNGPCYQVPSVSTQATYYMEYADNADSLETTLQAGNGCGGGNMFDLTALNTVAITGVSVNTSVANGQPLTVTIHYIPNGTFVGNETNAGAWTTLGTYNVTSNGGGVNGPVTFIDFGGSTISIPGGQTYAIYVEYPANYTTGAFPAANADLSFTPGVGLCSSFGGLNNPRTFNGRIHYGSTACSNTRVPVSAYQGQPVTVNLGADSTVCDTNGTQLDAGNAGSMFMWNTGDQTQTIQATMTGTYWVDVTDTANCFGTDTIDLNIVPGISVDLGADTTLCNGATLGLDAGNPGASYLWSTSDMTQMITVSTAANYYVDVTDSNGCTAVDSINVATANSPAGSFTGTQQAGNGLTWDFTDASTGPPTSWSWDFGDGSGTSTMQNPTYTYGMDGMYTVTLIVTNACGSDTSTQTLTVVGLDGKLSADDVTVYPNPNNGAFTLELTSYDRLDFNVEVRNLQGKLVYDRQMDAVTGTYKEDINLDVSSGVYFIKVATGGQFIVKKITVE